MPWSPHLIRETHLLRWYCCLCAQSEKDREGEEQRRRLIFPTPNDILKTHNDSMSNEPYKKPRAQLCVEPHSILSNAQPASFPRPGHWACRAHTHREDHLQVIEHLNLLWESLAAPSHQIVLTVGGRVAVCYRWGIHSKTCRSISYIFSTVVATGDREMFERAFPLKDSCVGRQTLSGGRIMNICVSMHTFPPQLLRTSWRSCLVFLLSSCILSVEVIGKVRDERGF